MCPCATKMHPHTVTARGPVSCSESEPQGAPPLPLSKPPGTQASSDSGESRAGNPVPCSHRPDLLTALGGLMLSE